MRRKWMGMLLIAAAALMGGAGPAGAQKSAEKIQSGAGPLMSAAFSGAQEKVRQSQKNGGLGHGYLLSKLYGRLWALQDRRRTVQSDEDQMKYDINSDNRKIHYKIARFRIDVSNDPNDECLQLSQDQAAKMTDQQIIDYIADGHDLAVQAYCYGEPSDNYFVTEYQGPIYGLVQQIQDDRHADEADRKDLVAIQAQMSQIQAQIDAMSQKGVPSGQGAADGNGKPPTPGNSGRTTSQTAAECNPRDSSECSCNAGTCSCENDSDNSDCSITYCDTHPGELDCLNDTYCDNHPGDIDCK